MASEGLRHDFLKKVMLYDVSDTLAQKKGSSSAAFFFFKG
jgi:hypothetical protein